MPLSKSSKKSGLQPAANPDAKFHVNIPTIIKNKVKKFYDKDCEIIKCFVSYFIMLFWGFCFNIVFTLGKFYYAFDTLPSDWDHVIFCQMEHVLLKEKDILNPTWTGYYGDIGLVLSIFQCLFDFKRYIMSDKNSMSQQCQNILWIYNVLAVLGAFCHIINHQIILYDSLKGLPFNVITGLTFYPTIVIARIPLFIAVNFNRRISMKEFLLVWVIFGTVMGVLGFIFNSIYFYLNSLAQSTAGMMPIFILFTITGKSNNGFNIKGFLTWAGLSLSHFLVLIGGFYCDIFSQFWIAPHTLHDLLHPLIWAYIHDYNREIIQRWIETDAMKEVDTIPRQKKVE